MKKAAKVVAIISLILDYIAMIALIGFGVYIWLNFSNLVNGAVDSVVHTSASSGAAVASSASSSYSGGNVGNALAGVVVAFGSAIAVLMVMVFSFSGGVIMLFPIITMHVAIKKLAKATCRNDMLAVSIVAIFAMQPIAAIMFLAIPDEAYAAQ